MAACAPARVIYLDAILFLGSGIIGTGHHWYWTGQSDITMALGAVFSALEVIPLTLLRLDAWDFIKLTRGKCEVCGRQIAMPHKWAFYFLIAVSFWGLNASLLLMVLITLFPRGILQMVDVLNNGYWHARGPEFLGGSLIKAIEWIRLVPDLIFGIAGVIPIVLAALLTYLTTRKQPATA